MSIILRNGLNGSRASLLYRSFSGTPVLETKQWRIENGLSANRNAESVLTDGPDYTYLDGRPTPLLHKQKMRMLKQREFASEIVQLSSELDFAKERYQHIQKEKEDERQKILNDRLRPKGETLKRK